MDTESVAHPERSHTEKRGDRERRVRAFVSVLVGSCADCGTGGEEAELYPVSQDHLTFFGGDELCGECARRHGAL